MMADSSLTVKEPTGPLMSTPNSKFQNDPGLCDKVVNQIYALADRAGARS